MGQAREVKLQEQGYRLTAARRAVLRVLSEAASPLSAGELHRRARAHHARLGLVTVYRTLEMLDSLGLVRRIHTDGACRGYAASSPGHHHTITCERCERAAEFDGDEVCLATAGVEARTGYAVSGHWLQLVGLCPACRGEGR
jgi:Fe2+ or Zn2+ uptake regulation protein